MVNSFLSKSTVLGTVWFVVVAVAADRASPTSSSAWPSQLWQALRGCDHTRPLGMITGKIEDWQITSSSVYPVEWDSGCDERYGRIYQPDGLGWCAKYKSASEWIQVDLGVPAKVTGFMTQGRGDGQEWVTSLMVSFSVDGFHWQYVNDIYGNQKVFEGNSDSYSVMHSYLDEPLIARFVKFHTVAWSKHPSMRVEILGCQVCNSPIALPPYGKLTSSSEKAVSSAATADGGGESSVNNGGGSCHAEDGFIVTNKAWCAKHDNVNQWLQFDIGPPTLITGLVTKGRGDGGKRHWVTRYRVSYSNDSNIWHFYEDDNHLDIKHPWEVASDINRSSSVVSDRSGPDGLEFGANSDREDVRYHYLTTPFVARFVRFHPLEWHRHISMRAGLLGCPYKGECRAGFMRVNEFTPCIENLAYRKESWINNRRQLKRHIRNQWLHGHASRAVDGYLPSDTAVAGAQSVQPTRSSAATSGGDGSGSVAAGINSCTVLDNFYVDRPIWMVDLGKKVKISGVLILTWLGKNLGSSGTGDDGEVSDPAAAETDHFRHRTTGSRSSGSSGSHGGGGSSAMASYRDYMYNLDKLAIYADNSAGRDPLDQQSSSGVMCGFVTRLNDALFRPRLHVQCKQPIRARYVYVEAWGVPNRYSRLFSAVLCEVMVYE